VEGTHGAEEVAADAAEAVDANANSHWVLLWSVSRAFGRPPD
jgi:hypothetical protein